MKRFVALLLVLVAGVRGHEAWTGRARRAPPKDVTLAHLRDRNVDAAASEITSLTGRNDVVEDIVREAFADASIALDDLAAFTTRTGHFDSAYLAMNALFVEMQKKQQLSELPTLSLHYDLTRATRLANFAAQSEVLRYNIAALLAKVEPHADAILKSLAGDVSRGEFARALAAREVTSKALLRQSYLSDVIKRIVASRSDTVFANLYAFINKCPYLSDVCHALSVAWEQLRAHGRGDGFEALQVWLNAEYLRELSQYDSSDKSYRAKCEGVVASAAPAHRATLEREYAKNIEKRNFVQINSWHQQFTPGMRALLRDVVGNLSREQLQNDRFGDLLDAVDHLPWLEDECWALQATRNKLDAFGMLGSHEHFRTLLRLKEKMKHSGFKNVNSFNADKCERAKESTPASFHKLLYTDTSNVRIFSYSYDEPLYCASEWHSYAIYTWVSRESDQDQYWNVKVHPNGRLSFHNIYHDLYLCRARGCTDQRTYRVEATDGNMKIEDSDGGILSVVGYAQHRRSTDFVSKKFRAPASNAIWYMM